MQFGKTIVCLNKIFIGLEGKNTPLFLDKIWISRPLCILGFRKKTHCLDLDLNGLLTSRNFWCIPGMLELYTIPKWKEFLKSREPILRKSYLSTFIHINKHMDGARDIFWIKSLNGTFLALQIKAFGPNNFDFHAWVKKCHFGNFWKFRSSVLSVVIWKDLHKISPVWGGTKVKKRHPEIKPPLPWALFCL